VQLRAVLDLIADSCCLGCDTASPTALCAECAAEMEGPLRALPTRHTLLTHAVALGAYAGPIGALVRRAKFQHDLRAVGLLCRSLDAALAGGVPALPDAVVPVPTTPWRVAARGFHLPDRLAAIAAPHFGAPVVRPLRRRWGPAQAGRTYGARLLAGDGLFSLAHPVAGHVLLVDDVVTSGTSVHAAAAELLAAGASAVSLVVLGAAGPLRRVPVGIS